MNITAAEIKKQFNRIVKAGWLPWFQAAAQTAGTSTAHLLAIGSRETNLKNIRGDFRGGVYHGFGVMQVDIGTDPEYCRKWTPDNVEHGITRGGEILKSKIDQVDAGQDKLLKFKGKQFTGRRCEPDDTRRIATAAYNCGLWAFYHFSRGEHVDSTTTGHDYSRDVYDRSLQFAALLDTARTEPGAYDREVMLQGKYATRGNAGPIGVPVETQPEIAKADYHAEPAEEQPDLQVVALGSQAITSGLATPASAVTVAPAQSAQTAVDGGGVNDPSKQVTKGGFITRVLAGIGGITGVGTALKGLVSGQAAIVIAGIVGFTVIALAIIFRQIVLDWARLKLHADPSKINVK